ncbi:uncharacterized protein VICG_01071 [Vittaforma corneae ATCC 50505]|uniref:Uncharacterized protein n=1 Tax=Vittaforma corneae (strain ATCC 50505) TaxID=993615 RepID=L2GNJ0_VITCO|nr:uncharacterized protein VICG_01071 [Vittaforma corneae ATCC 50505]ELA41887.1 hypothetical protein VICG_01071 [Vittaforma corneae ATCC 50505]
MKKIFNDSHVKLMADFLSKNLNSILRSSVPIEKQSRKLLILMDIDQLEILELHSSIGSLSEWEVDEQLKKFGFLSKINLFEKKAILADLIKKRLIKVISYNNSLVDYENLPENADSQLVYALLKHLHEYSNRPIPKSDIPQKFYLPEFSPRYPERRPTHLNIYNDATFFKHLSDEVLPQIAEECTPGLSLKERRRLTKRTFYSNERFPNRTNEHSIKDFLNDPNVTLRKKKALYYEPSVPINYKTDQKIELPKISHELRMIEPDVNPDLYDRFDLREFVDQTLFTNNNIPIPTRPRHSSIAEFRVNIKGYHSFVRFLQQHLFRLIISQDKYISAADAEYIAKEIQAYLTLAELEYFYDVYIGSASFKPEQLGRFKRSKVDGRKNKKTTIPDQVDDGNVKSDIDGLV